MTLTLNPQDYNANSLMPKETFIDKELDFHFDKLKTKEGEEISIANVMQEIIKICILLQSQARFIHHDNLNKMHPKILEETEIQAASYNSRLVWGLAIAGGLAALVGSAYGAYTMTTTINANINNLEHANILLQPISQKLKFGEAISQGLTQGSNFWAESEKGPRELRQYVIQHLSLLRDQFNQASQGAEGKLAEAERTLREIISAMHQIAYTLFHNQ